MLLLIYNFIVFVKFKKWCHNYDIVFKKSSKKKKKKKERIGLSERHNLWTKISCKEI